jgi:hypothetical protein
MGWEPPLAEPGEPQRCLPTLSEGVWEQFRGTGVWTGRFPKSNYCWDEDPLVGLEDTATDYEKRKLIEEYIGYRLEETVSGQKLWVKQVELGEEGDDWVVTVYFEFIKSCM